MQQKSQKRSFSIEGELKNTTVSNGLWEAFKRAVEKDPLKLYTTPSEAIRGLIRRYVREVDERARK
ncbi:MAG: hypothetical protein H0Z24_06730 [Thermosipho sp. (in: Bacteria)]|nr:hypothetical protein [Thermosipho sp. (in: thermotogales)]